ncbi:geranylgeranyl diphosphate synthase 3 [Byssothecium circinans]|uniref:geranylgeranyl diphosphate synthase n=1 Tax=Byssothecium circinans TaxID=147558 RepID=A0A6A5UE29_9PLEO|nr:geranylgeranyl diphosphate synthase 3 [Byssothecium circinans]
MAELRAMFDLGEDHVEDGVNTVPNGDAKAPDLPRAVSPAPITSIRNQDNEEYMNDAKEDTNSTERADTPMRGAGSQFGVHVTSEPATPDSNQSELSLIRPAVSMTDKLILEPYRYLSSLPGKGIRNITIDAFNVWVQVPDAPINIIKSAIDMLHSSSLMLDDLEDGSPLRRGKPSTHVVFGNATTINSATFMFINVIEVLRVLECPAAINLYTEEMRHLFIGQSYDCYWTNTVACPTVSEYIQMIDGKTGGLFRLSVGLLVSCSTLSITEAQKASLKHLCCLFGRYFQIRDDYQNLASPDYASQKGFCEDLDEGKYSLPLLFTLADTTDAILLRSLLQQRKCNGGLSFEQKMLVLDIITAADGLQNTLRVLRGIFDEIENEIARLEVAFGKDNAQLRRLLGLLRV